MLTAALGLLMLVAAVESFIGLVGNGVLVVWSFQECIKKFKKSSYPLIVLGLAGCRFLLQGLLMLNLILLLLFRSNHELQYFNVLWVLVSQASLWFATFLSVFYCKRITMLEFPVCLWLKQRANGLSLWCLLGHFFISMLLLVNIGFNSCRLSQGNDSFPYCLSDWRYRYIHQLTAGSWFPFMVFFVASGMLIVSLYRHHKKMNVHTAGRKDARAKAHITALKSLGCFLVLHLVYILASPHPVTIRSSVDLTDAFIAETLMAAYPSLHSVILVMGIPRGKQICQRILCKILCAWRAWG
ncbi:taste receptor type 2 member 5 [Ochotona curzoniae]|uniref:taste receptor type 2 member 5 n=1 Tax=Ochotona curzoniae TaxID=130825 RepID=UPI001B34A520|nr:taste receptor type 2 member 5 [Ochotona curzoniae]